MDKEKVLEYVHSSIENMKLNEHLDYLETDYIMVRGITQMLHYFDVINYIEVNQLNDLALNVKIETAIKIESEMK